MGLNGVAAPQLFGYDFGVNVDALLLSRRSGWSALLIFVSMRLKDSRIGRAWIAIREDEIAAEAMGVNRVKLKLLAFAIGAGFAGTTGTFYVAKLQTATPEMFMFPVSVMLLVMIVLGGMGSVCGRRARRADPAAPAILVPAGSDAMDPCARPARPASPCCSRSTSSQSIELIFGIILVLMMLLSPARPDPERRGRARR